MHFSQEVMNMVQLAVSFAKEKGYEFVTPEVLLYMLSKAQIFSDTFQDCGGNITLLEKDLLDYMEEYMDTVTDKEPELSEGVKQLLNYAANSAYNSNSKDIEIRHIIHGMWKLQDSYAIYFMEKQGVDEAEFFSMYPVLSDNENESYTEEEYQGDDSENNDWALYAPCLNDTLKDVNPLIGREAELERTIQVLCRKDKNNPLHIGEPGVGKTAIMYGLVQKIVENKVPEHLRGAKVFALDLGALLAGTQYRGDFEKRFKKVLSKIQMEEKPIIYIDEIHNLAGAGAVGESSFDASNMLKSYLAEGTIRFVGATTFEEYKKYFEKNKSLVRRFQNIEITEPSEEETIKILQGLKERYETYHGVTYAKDVIDYAVRMSAKYLNERFLPDKAIDLIDEAGSYRKLHPTNRKKQIVTKDIINIILTNICRIPIKTVEAENNEDLSTLESRMQGSIFGQDEAIHHVVNAVKFSKAGLLEDHKPLASLLFVGPTGVGKTEIAKKLSEELGVKLIRFDMSEYGEKHTVAKLIGSPAGYVGYEEGGLLTEAIRKTPSAVLLLDEIEKAHNDIYNILLQVMDYATLTDNQGRKADFRNVIVIMTSNAGARWIGKTGIGFHSVKADNNQMMDEVSRVFQPEFRNRLDKIVMFRSMDDEMASMIVDKKLKELGILLKNRNVNFSYDCHAKELLKKKGISTEFGAREVDRVIRNEIKPLFVDEILFGNLKNGGNILLSSSDETFVFLNENAQ